MAPELFNLLHALEDLRQLDPRLQCQTAAAFLLAAVRPGITVGQVMEYLSLPSATATRQVAFLTDRKKRGEVGFGLVELVHDGDDIRCKRLFLTPKGMNLAAELVECRYGARAAARAAVDSTLAEPC